MKKQSVWFIVLHLALLVYAGSGICSKLASGQTVLSLPFLLLYGGLICLLGIYAVLWQQVIKHLPLTTAYANKAITVVWGILFGTLFFKETLTLQQIIGAVIIILGVWLFVRADREDEHE
ncbi:EamA family transporter [Pygmaiobacter massiliensis]|uniref:EamA family transporter n=1 Tax=Pygmaiobacter massiliensis TaxID=1917873 RepID=UPI002A83FF00|nr:EamA family transporter [Pygmaiobacter massiliensis]MDY4784951.1 EamA family transporter [Pygmaiobacter massiliensis]